MIYGTMFKIKRNTNMLQKMFVRRVVYNNGIRVTQHCRKNNIFSDFYISHFASHKLFI